MQTIVCKWSGLVIGEQGSEQHFDKAKEQTDKT
jgi:hypothetical protein